MDRKGHFKRVVWAVDGITGELNFQKRTAGVISSLTKGSRTEIIPVCVMSPPNPYLETRWIVSFAQGTEKEIANRIARFTKKLALKGIQKPVVIRQSTYGTGKAVKALMDFSSKKKADLVVVSTHARKGLSRAMMGSFAESLVLQAKRPVLVVNPKVHSVANCKSILFPTDYSSASKKAFQQVLGLAKSLGASVTLFNKLELITEYAMPSFYATPTYSEYLDEDVASREKKSKQFLAMAEKAGVKAESIIDKKEGYIEGAVVKLAKRKKFPLIAMASQSGAVSSALLGSVTREILRKSPCPVWVVHPSGGRKK